MYMSCPTLPLYKPVLVLLEVRFGIFISPFRSVPVRFGPFRSVSVNRDTVIKMKYFVHGPLFSNHAIFSFCCLSHLYKIIFYESKISVSLSSDWVHVSVYYVNSLCMGSFIVTHDFRAYTLYIELRNGNGVRNDNQNQNCYWWHVQMTIIHQDLWWGKLVPNPYKRSELSNRVFCTFSSRKESIYKWIPTSNSLGEETALVNVSISKWGFKC